MQKGLKKIEAAGAQVVGISYDRQPTLAKFAKQRGITFPLLADPDSKVIEAYGLLNRQGKGRTEGLAHPGTFVLSRNGKVHAWLPGTVRQRHSIEDLVKAVPPAE